MEAGWALGKVSGSQWAREGTEELHSAPCCREETTDRNLDLGFCSEMTWTKTLESYSLEKWGGAGRKQQSSLW